MQLHKFIVIQVGSILTINIHARIGVRSQNNLLTNFLNSLPEKKAHPFGLATIISYTTQFLLICS